MTASISATGRRVEVNGASLYVEEQGTGDPILLVQPGLVSSAAYQSLAPLLARHYRVVTFDSRGHGRSTNPGGMMSYEQFTDDAATLADALELDRPFVGGWSDGGQIALEFGRRHPGRARALILGGAGMDIGTSAIKPMLREAFHVGDNGVADPDAFAADYAETIMPMMRRSHPGGEQQWRTVYQQSAAMYIAYGGMTTQAEAAQIDAPCLVVVGDRDEYVPVESALQLYRWLPDAELAILPGASHLRPMSDPATFACVTIDYLQRH